MIDQTTDDRTTALPDGTDQVIEGAAADGGTVTAQNTAFVTERKIPAPKGDAERPVTGSGSPKGGLAGSSAGSSSSSSSSSSSTSSGGTLADRFRNGREQFSAQAGDKARGLVGQGLGRTAEALANVSKMVGDTAPGIEERLGPEYGDYARRAAGAIENVANTIADKDPDQLIDDTRTFVRNSPGIALAGAAVVGFVVARLVKSGLGSSSSNNEDDEEDDRD